MSTSMRARIYDPKPRLLTLYKQQFGRMGPELKRQYDAVFNAQMEQELRSFWNVFGVLPRCDADDRDEQRLARWLKRHPHFARELTAQE